MRLNVKYCGTIHYNRQLAPSNMRRMSRKETLVLTEYTLPANLPGKLTLGIVSDLHEHEMSEVLALLREEHPDLIMVAGDTFERRDGNAWKWRAKTISGRLLQFALKLLENLFELFLRIKEHDPENAYHFLREAGKLAPVFLSLGNHEEYLLPEDYRIIKESGTTLLDNMDCEICVNGMSVRIGGLSSEVDLEWLEGFCVKDGCRILLCHHPEYYNRYLRDLGLQLVVSGHAHGGQIRIGGRGIYAPGQGLLPKYTKGLYHGTLLVTAGCSNPASVPRWGNPCEVVIVHLSFETGRA